MGFEPGNSRMRVSCVTTELPRSVNLGFVYWLNKIKRRKQRTKEENRARWLRGNARDSHSGGPGFKSRGRPTWLRFFSGFLNLRIAKELVIFKDKCRVGPHIPLLLSILFNVYSFSWSETIVGLRFPTDGSVIWTHTVAHRWGCLVSWLISSVMVWWLHWTRAWPGDNIGHGPTDVSHDKWGCLSSWLFTSRSWPGDYIGHDQIDVCHG